MDRSRMHSTSSSKAHSQVDMITLVQRLFTGITQPVIEIAHGLRSKRIPLGECIYWANFVGISILFHWDVKLWKRLGILKFYPTSHRSYYFYTFCMVVSGFWFWGLLQTMLRNRLIQRLTEVFTESGLKSPLGRLPTFIYDVPVDEYTRKLRLGRSSLSKAQFEKAKGSLEGSLQIYIDEMREDREHGTLDVIYSHTAMPTLTKIEKITEIPALHFVIGKTRAKQILASLQRVPHLMVAGQTGGGKSTFLRGLITTLYLNLKDLEFTLVDLKGGLEFQTFENLPRVKVIPTVESAISNLKNLESTLAERMALLKANECKDLDAYLALPEGKRVDPKGVCFSKKLNRHLLVVDEAAEMFLAGAHAGGSDIQTARRVLSQIARQGRSVGVHLVIATQRPDAKALDPQVKANLTGVLCFQMLNDASSITVLGVGRATELPAIPGRAIWKSGSDMFEVQTPFLSTEEVDVLLESHRLANSQKRKGEL